ncbi:UNVERIFIED_CONTAM: Transcription factor [Sesamum radiatum]|uniref:Transcription factor n=1 Tax=Sesamum radiatum TaxID=300843 RepID=A0AAW2W1Q0_SESRA
MEMEEYFDEMFGVKANNNNISAHHQIFTSHPFSTNTTNQLVEYPPPPWNLSCTKQQTITTTNAPSSSACQLIYVGTKSPMPGLEESLVSSVDRAASTFHDQFVSPCGLSANLTSNTLLNFSSPVLINQHDDLAKREIRPKRVSCSSLPVRSRLQARDHLVAERKRREKLGQLFITLSKVVPGRIKKLDKASILEDAIDYIKILEEQVRVLEIEQAEKCSEDIDNSTSKESSNIDESTNELSAASAIKVRISDRNVLIKILCKKQKGFMSRIHMEMEKMNLCEVDVRVMPFGSDALDITILAQMQRELCVTVKDIVDHLDMAFLNPPDMQD